jgi:adenosylhomocysteine nucleosidase
MTYIPDLSPYKYHAFPTEPNLLAVGWLDSTIPYPKGSVAKSSITKLIRFATQPVNRTRGFHVCQFCNTARSNGEIRVAGADGIVYAAPVLISHYIEKHEYKPPDQFLEALERMSEAGKKVAIISALERELRPLIEHWPSQTIAHGGRDFTFHESSYAVVVCAGIGPEAARRAAQAAIVTYQPKLLISAGVAGALVPELHVGETIFPAAIIDASDSSRHKSAIASVRLSNSPLARTILVSYPELAGAGQKQKLGKAYGAHAVDMEAAAIAKAAQLHGLPFLAIKSISDEINFELPEMPQFIRHGQFRTKAFVFHIAFRPWLWRKVLRLARNTKIASENLCAWLRESVLTNTIVPGELGTSWDARASDTP